MCGIVGFINVSGTPAFKLENVFKQMLFVDQFRGSDATGAAFMPPDGDYNWIKQPVPPEVFFDDKNVRQFFGKFKTTGFAMGHNRAKTVGRNTADNAHPFEVGGTKESDAKFESHIVGVHNGTISNKYQLCHEGYKYDVDSHAFMAGISENGIRETVKTADGAFSVVYFDVKEKTINFIRNEERPMWFLEVTDPSSSVNIPESNYILFGSELLLLMWIATRNGLRTGKHFETKPLEHYSFKPGVAKPTTFMCEEHVKTNTYSHYENYRYTRGGWKNKKDDEDEKKTDHRPSPNLMLPHNVKLFPKVTNEVPFELKKCALFTGNDYSTVVKSAVARIWNTSVKESLINFQVADAVDLGSSMQIIGALAGKKKTGLPIVVTSIIDKAFFDRIKPDTILCAKLMHKSESADTKTIEFIVKDPMILMYGTAGDVGNDDSIMDQQFDEVMHASC